MRMRVNPNQSAPASGFSLRGLSKDMHRTEQAGEHQGRSGAIGSDVGEGDLGGIGLLIADQAVNPGVDDFDGDHVIAGLEGFGDFDAVGGVPGDAEQGPVDGDFGEVLDVAEIEPQGRAGFEPAGRGVDGFGIGANAGEVLHAGFGVVGPGGQRVKSDGCGRAAVGLEANVHGPSIAASKDSAIAGNVRASAAVGLRNTTKTVPQGSICSGTVVRPFAMV